MFKFITKQPFWVNLLVAVGILLFLVIGFFVSLGSLTLHDKTIRVPQVTGLSVSQAEKLLESQGFTVSVQDSVYIDTAAPLAVVRQSPDWDELVKLHRTVYLTINRAIPPLIDMPDLRGFSFRSAAMYLESIGLKVGDTTYTPDIARNAVKEQLLNGKPIVAGTKVQLSTAISLVLGSGLGNSSIEVPDLSGLTVDQARSFLASQNLDLGVIIATDEVTDTAAAFIVQQRPAPYQTAADGSQVTNRIRAGQLIDIYISKSPRQPGGDSTSTQY